MARDVVPARLGLAGRRVAASARTLVRWLLPGRSLSVFLASLLGLVALVSTGNYLSDGAVHATWLYNLVHHGSLTIVEVPSWYFLHEGMFRATGDGYLAARPRGVGYLSLPAWLGIRVAGLVGVGVGVAVSAAWCAGLYALCRVEPAIRHRVSRPLAGAGAVGLFGANLALLDPVSLARWDAMLAVQLTSAFAVAAGTAAVFRMVQARAGDQAGLVGAALFLVGPVAFWGVGTKDHAIALAGTAIAFAAFAGYHRTGRSRYRGMAYAALASTVWATGPNGLIPLAALFVVDLGTTLWDPKERRAREVPVVVVLFLLAAIPHPISDRVTAGQAALPELPGGGDGTDGEGNDTSSGEGPDGSTGPPFRLPDLAWFEELFDPILGQIERLWSDWTDEPDRQPARLVKVAVWNQDRTTIPLLLISPALLVALLPRRPVRRLMGGLGRLREVLQAAPRERVDPLDVAMGLFVLVHLFVYLPLAVGPWHPHSFDHRYFVVLYVPLAYFGGRAVRSDVEGRLGTILVAAVAAFLALLSALVPVYWTIGGHPYWVVAGVQLLGMAGLAAVAGAVILDRWALGRGTTLPWALGFALAISGLWLFNAAVIFGRGVTHFPGGGFVLPVTGALHGLFP